MNIVTSAFDDAGLADPVRRQAFGEDAVLRIARAGQVEHGRSAFAHRRQRGERLGPGRHGMLACALERAGQSLGVVGQTAGAHALADGSGQIALGGEQGEAFPCVHEGGQAFGAQPHGLGGVAFAGSGAFTRIRRAQAGAFKDEGSEGLRVPNSGRKSDATAKGVPDYGRLAAFSAALAIRDGADECEQGFGLRMERVGLRTIGAVAAPTRSSA